MRRLYQGRPACHQVPPHGPDVGEMVANSDRDVCRHRIAGYTRLCMAWELLEYNIQDSDNYTRFVVSSAASR